VQRPTRLNLSAEDFELEDSDRKPPILVKKNMVSGEDFPLSQSYFQMMSMNMLKMIKIYFIEIVDD
jgi:hypothetical protein